MTQPSNEDDTPGCFILFALLAVFLTAAAGVYWAWNGILPLCTDLPRISFLTSMGLLIVLGIVSIVISNIIGIFKHK